VQELAPGLPSPCARHLRLIGPGFRLDIVSQPTAPHTRLADSCRAQLPRSVLQQTVSMAFLSTITSGLRGAPLD
jgi:hypothetical protein